MAPTLVSVPHILIDEAGRAWVEGTTCKVLEIVLDHIAHGWTAEEIYFQHYRQIGLAHIHAALSYYYDHKAEMDSEIHEQLRRVARLRTEAGESPFVRRLRTEGRLS
ncbi:MAG: DUF433 domain-containing protein [Acidobacteriota bacterium]